MSEDFEIIEDTYEEKLKYSKRAWGQTEHEITIDEIHALFKGKAIAFDDGEYTHIITLRKGDIPK